MDGGDPNAGKRREGVKKGIDIEHQRRRREDHLISIRKSKKEEQLNKRRGIVREEEQGVPDESGAIVPVATAATASEIARYAHLVMHGATEAERLEGTAAFRKVLSAVRDPPLDEVVESGVIPHFVSFLMYDASPQLQFEAAWSLTNVASGLSAHTKAVVHANAVPAFIRLLASPREEVREQATWALGNIAGDSAAFRDLVLSEGGLGPLLGVFQPSAKLSVLRNATWTLSNLCRGKPAPDFRVVGHALPTLAAVLNMSDHDVLCDALWALSYLSDGPNQRVQAVLESAIMHKVVDLLAYDSVQVITPALRTIGNIVTGDDLQTQAVLNAGALAHLVRLLQHPKRALRKEAAWAVSNIMAGTNLQIQQVLDANIMQILVQLLLQGESDVRKEAAWAVCNGTSGGTPDQIAHMVQCGILNPLVRIAHREEVRLAGVIIEGFANILKAGQTSAEDPVLNNKFLPACTAANVPALLEYIRAIADQNNQEYNELLRLIETLEATYFGWGEGEYAEAGEISGGDEDGDDEDDDEEGNGAPPGWQQQAAGPSSGWAGAGVPGGADFGGFSSAGYQ